MKAKGAGFPVRQPLKGYRFTQDPLILAAHVPLTDNARIVDIGCGCGIIPLILARRQPGLTITGVEIQAELCDLARDNVIAHGLDKDVRILHGDIRDIDRQNIRGPADLIVSNPPYRKKGTGRLSPNPQTAMARYDITLDIGTVFQCAGRLIADHGKICIIFPFDRRQDLFEAAHTNGFSPEWVKYIHVRPGAAPLRILLYAGRMSPARPASDLEITLPPLFLHTRENKFSEDYLSLFKP